MGQAMPKKYLKDHFYWRVTHENHWFVFIKCDKKGWSQSDHINQIIHYSWSFK